MKRAQRHLTFNESPENRSGNGVFNVHCTALCQNRTYTIYVQATSNGVNGRASEPLPSAISFVPGIKIMCRSTDLTVDLTGVCSEGTFLVAYKNLNLAHATYLLGIVFFM